MWRNSARGFGWSRNWESWEDPKKVLMTLETIRDRDLKTEFRIRYLALYDVPALMSLF